ncbi:hypothetical protein [Planctomicrobium sp. SH527]|uniref:hypothetical protein n=1 Tax=Planctomicrobium sp. SH527 TaxID=3448123 RepID=UPI003F5B0FF5
MKTRFHHLALLIVLLLVGCGGAKDAPTLAQTGGTVLFKGKPLNGASVTFTPESGPIAVGKSDADRKFQLSTQGRSGAMVGAHRVAVTAFTPAANAKSSVKSSEAEADLGENYVPTVSSIPEMYGDPKKSGLSATVSGKSAENDFKFDLK